MFRKFAILTVTMISLAGLAMAAADESPLEKIMEQINKKHGALRKATNTATNFKKGVAGIPKDAEEIIKLAKEARDVKEPAEAAKKPLADWQKLMDDMISTAGNLAKVAAKPDATQVQAKEAFTAYNKTCAACHAVFKKEE